MSINLTPLVRRWLAPRVAAAASCTGPGLRDAQLRQLRRLLANGARTAFGRENGLDATAVRRLKNTAPRDIMQTAAYRAFAAMPVRGYADFRPWVMRMVGGEKDVLWPGRCRRFAQSSGTSDGKSKYIPVTADSLRLNHYPGATDAVAHYLHNNPQSRMFAGKGFILGGSFANELDGLPRGVRVGDLSANLIEAVNPLVNLVRVPSRRTALMADWRQKLPALAREAAPAGVTNISGVPSWFLGVLKEVMALRGVDSIHRVWPDLEVFFHGGISFDPFREQYNAITDAQKMHYVETYNASEGFFAVQDLPGPGAMRLLADIGVYYEFVPLDRAENPVPDDILPACEVKEGEVYSLIITAPNGLWRYAIGDTVQIVSADPLRIRIAGRTKSYINAFGEEVMMHNAVGAMTHACAEHGCAAAQFTVAPVFADGKNRRGRHQWIVGWNSAPADPQAFAVSLDRALQDVNSDYQAKRAGDIFMDLPLVTAIPPAVFDAWLERTGKLGGQRKVPMLSNDRRLADSLLALAAEG